MALKKQCLQDTTGLMNRNYNSMYKLKTDQILALEVESGHRAPPRPRSYLRRIPTGKGKISLLQWSITGYMNHSPLCLRVVGQPKKSYTMNFFMGFYFVWVFCSIILFCAFLLFCCALFCVLRKREHEVECAGN